MHWSCRLTKETNIGIGLMRALNNTDVPILTNVMDLGRALNGVGAKELQDQVKSLAITNTMKA